MVIIDNHHYTLSQTLNQTNLYHQQKNFYIQFTQLNPNITPSFLISNSYLNSEKNLNLTDFQPDLFNHNPFRPTAKSIKNWRMNIPFYTEETRTKREDRRQSLGFRKKRENGIRRKRAGAVDSINFVDCFGRI